MKVVLNLSVILHSKRFISSKISSPMNNSFKTDVCIKKFSFFKLQLSIRCDSPGLSKFRRQLLDLDFQFTGINQTALSRSRNLKSSGMVRQRAKSIKYKIEYCCFFVQFHLSVEIEGCTKFSFENNCKSVCCKLCCGECTLFNDTNDREIFEKSRGDISI